MLVKLLEYAGPMCTSCRSLHDSIERFAFDTASRHRTPHVSLEPIPVAHEIVRSVLVQRITRVRLQEQELQPHYDRVQVENWFPVFSKDIQAHVALKIDVRMVDLFFTFDFRWLVWEVLADCEGEIEDTAFVQAFVGCECECEVQDVVGIREVCLHRRAEGKFREIWKCESVRTSSPSLYRSMV